MQTKYFVLAAAMVCAVSMVANNKVSRVIKDAADKNALVGVNVTFAEKDIMRIVTIRKFRKVCKRIV